MANVEYIIKVIEPDKEYLKPFVQPTLDDCRREAQSYLWSRPEGTKYIYVATRMRDDSNI